MVFSPNPLSLSVSDPAFETWLRKSGYLDLLDQRTTQLHQTTAETSSTTTQTSSKTSLITTKTSILSHFTTLIFSLLTINPFAKLTSDDFSASSLSWTETFLGCCESYSLPKSKAQAEMRLHENVKRYARNYACLLALFFGCSLYQMPLALVGLIACLALWEVLKFCSDKWRLDQNPAIRQCLIRVCQCVTAVILFYSNVQMALFCTMVITYAVMVVHAAFRKLAPAKQSSHGRRK